MEDLACTSPSRDCEPPAATRSAATNPWTISSLVNVKTPSRGLGQPEPSFAEGAAEGGAVARQEEDEAEQQQQQPEFLGEVLAVGELISSKFAEAFSGSWYGAPADRNSPPKQVFESKLPPARRRPSGLAADRDEEEDGPPAVAKPVVGPASEYLVRFNELSINTRRRAKSPGGRLNLGDKRQTANQATRSSDRYPPSSEEPFWKAREEGRAGGGQGSLQEEGEPELHRVEEQESVAARKSFFESQAQAAAEQQQATVTEAAPPPRAEAPPRRGNREPTAPPVATPPPEARGTQQHQQHKQHKQEQQQEQRKGRAQSNRPAANASAGPSKPPPVVDGRGRAEPLVPPSIVKLADGTDAMVRCMRKAGGNGALECPVCLQLFHKPVTPVDSECRCTFCEGCFMNLVQFGGQCTKCNRGLPRDVNKRVSNSEIMRAVAAFQQSGGEEAQYATMMTEKHRSQDAGKAKAKQYRILDLTELQLDPKPLASGAYGQVFKGVWRTTKQSIAVKKILRTSVMTHQQTMESFKKEVEILSMLDHPHVLKLYGAVLDDDNICIVTELVPGGSLFDLIHTKPQLKPEAVIVIGSGVCKGMTYLHSMGIIHRDLKPGNLLMGAVSTPQGPQLVVKVADFGLARVQDTARTMTGGIGTSQYTAPEVLRSERYDYKADIFSFGVILWEIHARRIPYSDMNQMQIAVAVATQDHRPPPPKTCPAPFWELMTSCWVKAPRLRPSFPEVLSQLEDMQFVFNLAASAHGGGGGRPAAAAVRGNAAGARPAAAPALSPLPKAVKPQEQHSPQQQQQQQQAAVRAGGGGFSPSRRQEGGGQSPLRAVYSPSGGSNHSQVQSPGQTASPPAIAGPASLQVMDDGDVEMGESGGGQGRVIRVPAEYRTIGEALSAAANGDTVAVSAGHYREVLRVWGKRVSLVGEGSMQDLLIEGGAGAPAMSVGAGGVLRISNFMLQSAAASVIDVGGGKLMLEDSNVSGSGGVGLRLHSGGQATIKRSVLCRCAQHGLMITASSRASVVSSSIFENGSHGVVASTQRSHVDMRHCMVSFNGGVGVFVDGEAGARVEDNDLRNNTKGPHAIAPASHTLVSISKNLTTA